MTEETNQENQSAQEPHQEPTTQAATKPEPKPENNSTDNGRDDYVSVDELKAAQNRIHELNKENQKRREQIKEWETLKEKGYDPDKLLALADQQKEMERKQMEEQGRYQELIQQMEEERQYELNKIKESSEQENTALRSSLQKYLVDNEATVALAKEGVADSKILNKYVKERMKVVEQDGDYKTIIVDDNGEPKLKRGGAPYTANDLINEMKEDNEFSRLFPAPNVSGNGSQNSQTPSGKKPPMEKSRSKMTPKEKTDFQREYGFDKYFELPI